MPPRLGSAAEVKNALALYEVAQAGARNWTLLPSCNQEPTSQQTYISVHTVEVQTMVDLTVQIRAEDALPLGTCLSLFTIYTVLLTMYSAAFRLSYACHHSIFYFFARRKFVSSLLDEISVVVIPSIFSSSIFLWASRASRSHVLIAYCLRLYNQFLVHYGMGAWMRCSDVRWCVGKSITVWICGGSYPNGFYTESRFHDFFMRNELAYAE